MKIDFCTGLREYKSFIKSDDKQFVYICDGKISSELRKIYGLTQITQESADFERIRRILHWTAAHLTHRGDYDNHDPQESLVLLDRYFDRKDAGINCLSLSIVLAECCLAVGICARVVYMMPREIEDGDNHVVVEAWAGDLGKWIMADPTYGCFVLDSADTPLSLPELRVALMENRTVHLSADAHYNGERDLDQTDILQYYAKNLFFFRCKLCQCYGAHREREGIAEIAPDGFDVHTRMVQNLLFRIAEYGESPIFKEWLSFEGALQNQYVNMASFCAPPQHSKWHRQNKTALVRLLMELNTPFTAKQPPDSGGCFISAYLTACHQAPFQSHRSSNAWSLNAHIFYRLTQ